ncbi:MAG: PAS domain S-box protein [Bacteroidota bacterium]
MNDRQKSYEELEKELNELRQAYGLLQVSQETDRIERTKAEDAVRISEMQKEAILNGITANIAFVDKDLRIIWANKTAAESVNKSPEEMKGHTCHHFWANAPAPCKDCPSLKALQTKKSEHTIMQTPDGRYWDERGEPVFDSEGNLLGVVEIATDITDRKHAEKALRQSEARFRSYFELPLTGRSITSPETSWIEVNKALCEILGYTEAELLQMTSTELTHPDDLARDLVQFNKILAGEIDGYTMEKRFIHKKGHIIFAHMAAQCIRKPDQSVDNIVAIIIDISERNKAEEGLRKSEQRYRLLAENITDVIWVLDPQNMHLLYVSPSAELLLGYTPDELLAMPFGELLIPDNREPFLQRTRQRVETFMANPEPIKGYRNEVVHLRKDGSHVWTEAVNHYYLNETTGLVEIQGVSRDITDQKKSEEVLRESEEKFKVKNEELLKVISEKDKFFSIIAHDLRSPFNAFLGFTRMMVEDLPSLRLDEIQKMALSMRRSATNLFDLLENLLQWSRIQRGVTSFEREYFLLISKIPDTLQSVQESANKKGIHMVCQIPDNLTVFADQNMLGSVIRNMASNAVKFTPKGGKVIITAKPASGSSVEISVKDTGIGMNEETFENLFRFNTQTSRRGTDGEPSSGLGLIICKEFVEKHGGKLWLESEEGMGSTFHFTLPGKES